MVSTLTRNQLKVRVLRALSGLSQEELEREAQVENIAGIENGSRHVTASQVARMCRSAGLTPESCEGLIQEYEAQVARAARRLDEEASRRPDRRPVPEPALSIAGIIEEAEARISRIGEERRALRAAEREVARSSWERVKGLSFADMALLARSAREYQTWALVELICDESAQAIEQEHARDLAGLAVEIAGRVRAAEGWCLRLRGFALAHLAKAQHAAGDPGAARETLAEAERLWESGEDPEEILDADRFRSLKESVAGR